MNVTEHSIWIMQNIQRINKILRVSFEGIENKVTSLFEETKMRKREKKS